MLETPSLEGWWRVDVAVCLGVRSLPQNQPTREFSGGWRMRIALAQALFLKPDLLLLDEPTNHLDVHALTWLEEFLLTWERTVVIVSHDRGFLNKVTTQTVFLHRKRLMYYGGNYDTFLKVTLILISKPLHQQIPARIRLSARVGVPVFVRGFCLCAKLVYVVFLKAIWLFCASANFPRCLLANGCQQCSRRSLNDIVIGVIAKPNSQQESIEFDFGLLYRTAC